MVPAFSDDQGWTMCPIHFAACMHVVHTFRTVYQFAQSTDCTMEKYGSTNNFLVRDMGQVQNGYLYKMYRRNSKKNKAARGVQKAYRLHPFAILCIAKSAQTFLLTSIYSGLKRPNMKTSILFIFLSSSFSIIKDNWKTRETI